MDPLDAMGLTVEDAQALRLARGETLVLRTRGETSPREVESAVGNLRRAFPGNAVLVLDERVDLDVFARGLS